MERIIRVITESGTSTYDGTDADTLIDQLGLEVKPVVLGKDVPDFTDEVRRKVEESKPKQEED